MQLFTGTLFLGNLVGLHGVKSQLKKSKTIRFQETEISFVQEVYMVLWNHSFGSARENSCSMKDKKFYVKELIFKTQKLSKLNII